MNRIQQPLLSISVPIYNRSVFLERMLNNFLEDKDLFKEKIHLSISDNCSSENLALIVDHYKKLGLNIQFYRNSINVGGDNNIISCYQNAIGKYVLVLGSDDIPKPGIVREIIEILQSNNLGVLHLNHHNIELEGVTLYSNHEAFLVDINVWITFISSNIVLNDFIKQIDFEKYRYSNLSQVVVFILAASKSSCNAIYSKRFLEDGDDSNSNGGYNLFKVFIVNLLSIFREAAVYNLISMDCYEEVKKKNFKNLLAGDFARKLILGKKSNHNIDDGWPIVWNYYGRYLYFYWFTVKELAKILNRRLLMMGRLFKVIA